MNTLIRLRRGTVIVTSLALVFAACAGDDDDTLGEAPAGETAPPDNTQPATEITPPSETDTTPEPSQPGTSEPTGATSTEPVTGNTVPGGSVTFGVEQEFTAYNNDTSAQVLFANTRVLNMVQPSAYIVQPDLTVALNTDLLTEVELASSDPQVVVYSINPEAVWQDGEPIDCDDFYLEWLSGNGRGGNTLAADGTELLDDSGKPIPVFDAASDTGYEDISEVECSDDGFTFTTTYSTPFIDYQSLFANLVPAHVVEQVTGVADLTTATDPAEIRAMGEMWSTGFTGFDPERALSGAWYKIEAFNPGETVILTRNENYWGTPGVLDEIVFRLVPSATDQPAALINGDLQVIQPQPEPDLLDQLEGVDGIATVVEGGVTFEHYDFNQAIPGLDDLNVRMALALCIDREEIVETLVRPLDPDFGVLNNRIYVPASPFYVDGGTDYAQQDIEQARALLEESGYTPGDDGIYEKGGVRLSFRLGRNDPNPRRQHINELAAAQCLEAGIELTDDPSEDFNAVRLPASDYDIALFAWVATPFNSSNTPLYTSDGDQNWNNYVNTEIDELFAQANVEADADRRAELMNEIDRTMWEDMATLPLFQFPNMMANTTSLTNVIYNGPQSPTWNANEWAYLAE